MQWKKIELQTVHEVFRFIKMWIFRKLEFLKSKRIQSEWKNCWLFFIFSVSVLFWSLKVFSEWCWVVKWSSRRLRRESESVRSLSWGEKKFKRCTWKRKKLVALKNLQSSGVPFRAWRASLKSTRNAVIWNYPENFEDLAVWLWQPEEGLYITIKRIWEETFST